MKKEIKEKVKKNRKKDTMRTVMKRVAELNRGPLKEKPKTKYEVAYNFIKEHSGMYSRKQIIEHLEKPPYNITAGTSSTCFCQFMNKRYRPAWATLDMTIKEGKVFLE